MSNNTLGDRVWWSLKGPHWVLRRHAWAQVRPVISMRGNEEWCALWGRGSIGPGQRITVREGALFTLVAAYPEAVVCMHCVSSTAWGRGLAYVGQRATVSSR